MKNRKKIFGVVIYKEGREKEFEEKLIYALNHPLVKLTKGDKFLAYSREKQGWILCQFKADGFLTYKDFDNFLWVLSEELSKNDIGMVLGHNGEDGFFWMDYPDKSSELKEFDVKEKTKDVM
ncbi:MAG: hypothetical protein DRN24_06280 [Thermoplasmata archaeon]|nr:MAG: hypothetical protein DRN24_06280 [Thermoplasmata archaeon]